MTKKEYIRNCPTCNLEIVYCHKSSFNTANNNNSNCKKCASKKNGFITRFATKGKNIGKDNPFYGKTHSVETKEKLKKIDKSYTKTKEFKDKISSVTKGKNNPMYQKKVYDIWLKKHGKDIADKKEKSWKHKLSIAMSGKNNPMYGKPTPQGSGQGWKGWYKGIFFRSLRELCYLIYLDINNIEWERGETICIPYKDYKGTDKTYRPDFIINNNTVVEIKPKRLHNTPLVLSKKQAAISFCNKKGWKYEIVDVDVDYNLIDKSIQDGYTVLQKRYKEKYEQFKHIRDT